ncbi:hypothetical protein ACFVYT_06635 [Streptomyces sp. NPDC058290]|uniref:hypothetical protein n=1 Tax=Streptomyces sp. NPDC058290 TaxID=3346426 RepID=UPI0036ED23D6
MTPTGTNLLGLVKHVTSAEAVHFGEARPRGHRPGNSSTEPSGSASDPAAWPPATLPTGRTTGPGWNARRRKPTGTRSATSAATRRSPTKPLTKASRSTPPGAG